MENKVSDVFFQIMSVCLPVQDVEKSVEAEHCDVVRGQVLDDPNFIEHDDLGNEGERFKP